MKIAIIYNTSDYLLRFRTELIEMVQTAGHEVIAVTPRDEATPRLGLINVRWCHWKLEGQSLNPFKDLVSIFSLHRILSSEKPDVVLNFTIKPVLYGSLVAHWVGCQKIISMITGMGSIFLPGGMRKRVLLGVVHMIYRIAMKPNHRVIFQNDDDMGYFLAYNLVKKDQALRINGSGVNLQVFAPKPGEVKRGSFLLISRMIKEKGIYDFVEAARALKLRFPFSSFVLIGPIDNNPGAITREEISDWEQEGIISYLGIQADIRSFLATCEVYVLPTYYLEGIPRSILEALSMGKPVVTTDWRGCRDTVSNGINGFLVPPHDVVKLTEAMARFLEDQSLSAGFGVASRRLAEQRFNVMDINSVVIQSMGLLVKDKKYGN